MVFSSSVPVYLDAPNWPQQQVNGNEIPQQLPFLHQPNPNVTTAANSSVGRPGNSMAERARLAKVAQPEGPLKCPRCDSMNTKFCYFNNYSLSQPRHFCKTCRRYWTRGGALRNVPVGGGCRRNKKNKNSSNKSKSPAVPDRQLGGLEFPTAAVQPTEALQTDSNMYGFNFGRIVHTSTMEDINNSGSSQQKLMTLQGGLDHVSREMTILSSFGASDRIEQPYPNFFPGFVMPQVGNYNLGQMKMEEMLNGGLDFTRPVIDNSGYNQGGGSSYNLI